MTFKNIDFSPVFIVGNSRSGTTLVSRILSNSKDVFTFPHELHFFDEFNCGRNLNSQISPLIAVKILSTLMYRFKEGYFNSNSEKYFSEAETLLYDFCQPYTRKSLIYDFYLYVFSLTNKKIIVEQTPRNIFYIDDIIDVFPNAKFIGMVRDPRGIMLSQKNKWKACEKFDQPLFEIKRAKSNYHPLTLSILWRKCIDKHLMAISKFNSSCYHELIYEKLTSDPDREIFNICDFLKIDNCENFKCVSVEMTSNLNEEGKVGINDNLASRWSSELSDTEIFICEFITKKYYKYFYYSITGSKPTFIGLIIETIRFSYHFCFSIYYNFFNNRYFYSKFKKL